MFLDLLNFSAQRMVGGGNEYRGTGRLVMVRLASSLISFIAPLLEASCLGSSSSTEPPRLLRNPTTRRVLGRVTAETAWSCLQDALNTPGVNERAVLGVRVNDSAVAGLRPRNAEMWAKLELQLYIEDQQDLFVPCNKFTQLLDPSVYAPGIDVNVGIIWSHEIQHAAYAVHSILPAGTFISPYEYEMCDSMWARIRENKIQRKKALDNIRTESTSMVGQRRLNFPTGSTRVPTVPKCSHGFPTVSKRVLQIMCQ